MFGRLKDFLASEFAVPARPLSEHPCADSEHVRETAKVLRIGSTIEAPCRRCGYILIRKLGGWKMVDPPRRAPASG
jgi:hypothetical protein